MTQIEFLRVLKARLKGLPVQVVNDILADYRAHFCDAVELGRNEEDVAASLGNPNDIARILRAEVGFRRLEEGFSFKNLFVAVVALMGLATLDILFLMPILVATLIAFFAAAAVVAAIGAVGLWVISATVMFDLKEEPQLALARGILGLGYLSGSIGGAALLLVFLGMCVRPLGRYARLHAQVSRPLLGQVKASPSKLEVEDDA